VKNGASAPRTVVFDLGGVLIDWNPRYLYRSLIPDERAMEDFLATVCNGPWNEQQDAGRSIAEAEAELLARHPHHEKLIRAYYSGFDRMLAGPIEGTVAILEALHARGVPLYALTNWSRETFPHARRRFAFLERFRGIVVSGELGMMKPDARIFRHLTETHGLQPADCVFIDDAPKNVSGARAAGLHAIHFTGPDALRAELRGLGFL
jgi:HAD superfamily hydrolase (TIGR01509 family)